jgi:hypothetical protein
LKIKNLDCFIFIIKNWPNDAHVGCVENKPQNMHEFLSSEVILIEEHKKLLKEEGWFRKDDDEI